MTLSDSARSVLAALWERIEQPSAAHGTPVEGWPDDHPVLAELEREGLVHRDACDIVLTEQGWSEAARTAHCRPLAELAPGDEGYVACVQSHDQRAFHKLMAMGILPGNPVKLLRRSPAYVFQVSYSQFAVDRDIAEKIYVRRTDRSQL